MALLYIYCWVSTLRLRLLTELQLPHFLTYSSQWQCFFVSRCISKCLTYTTQSNIDTWWALLCQCVQEFWSWTLWYHVKVRLKSFQWICWWQTVLWTTLVWKCRRDLQQSRNVIKKLTVSRVNIWETFCKGELFIVSCNFLLQQCLVNSYWPSVACT